MRFLKHPLFDTDAAAIFDHVLTVTQGNFDAADRRIDEIAALIDQIVETPQSGIRLDGDLDGFLAKHGGQRRRLTIVFKPEPTENHVYGVLVAFGGADWLSTARHRTRFPA